MKEDSTIDKKADGSGKHGKEGSKKDMSFETKVAKKKKGKSKKGRKFNGGAFESARQKYFGLKK